MRKDSDGDKHQRPRTSRPRSTGMNFMIMKGAGQFHLVKGVAGLLFNLLRNVRATKSDKVALSIFRLASSYRGVVPADSLRPRACQNFTGQYVRRSEA